MSWEFTVKTETQWQLPTARTRLREKRKGLKMVNTQPSLSEPAVKRFKSMILKSRYPSVFSLLNNSALSGCLSPPSQLHHWQSLTCHPSLLPVEGPSRTTVTQLLMAVSGMDIFSGSGLVCRTCEHRDKYRGELKPVACLDGRAGKFLFLTVAV